MFETTKSKLAVRLSIDWLALQQSHISPRAGHCPQAKSKQTAILIAVVLEWRLPD
jgi:hypothetical protein